MGAVLAGGRSSRFGRDKRDVVVAGQTLLERTCGVLREVFEDVVVVGGASESSDQANEKCGATILDLAPGGGPLQALIAALRAAEVRGHRSIVVVACDLPRLDRATVLQLAAPIRDGAIGRVPQVDGRLQVLAAHWSVLALRVFEAAWDAGERSVTRACAGHIEVVDDVAAWTLADVDVPGDFDRIAGPIAAVTVQKETGLEIDWVAREEPLEIIVGGEALAVLLRSPNGVEDDLSLAAGFLLGEGIIDRMEDLDGLAPCLDPAAEHRENRVLVTLAVGVSVPESARRVFASGTSCGLCGKAAIASLTQRLPAREARVGPRMADVAAMGPAVRERQLGFESTGAVHAAALFEGATLRSMAEDVGRHNAVDKLLGRALRVGELPLRGRVLWVSGRVSFELVQKALLAGVDALVAVGAPTSMAIELARSGGLHLIGFAREGRANVYAGGLS